MNIYMSFPQGKLKAVTFSYDDGTRHDMTMVDCSTNTDSKALSISTAACSTMKTGCTVMR